MTTTKQVELELKAVQDKDEEEVRELKRAIEDMQNQSQESQIDHWR